MVTVSLIKWRASLGNLFRCVMILYKHKMAQYRISGILNVGKKSKRREVFGLFFMVD